MINEILTDSFDSLSDMFTKREAFNASFGNESAISSRFNKGLVISKYRKLTRKRSFENLLLVGPTGSGKTTKILLKNLYSLKNCSMVINDPSKELYQYASGYLSQYFNIKTLNFSDSTKSSGYNLLSRIKSPNDINKIADLLVRATIDKNTSDPFWGLQSRAMLSIFIRLVMIQAPEYRNMSNVLHVLNHFGANRKAIDFFIAKSDDSKLKLDYRALTALPDKTLLNIYASCKACLQIFESPEIARVCSMDTLNMDELRRKPTVIFLHNSIADMQYVSILNSIFFEQLYCNLLNDLPNSDDLDLFIIMEEASSLFVPILPTAIANTRKYRISNVISVQAIQQLSKMYGENHKNIASNCLTHIYLPGQSSMETLKELETISGKTTYVDKNKNEKIGPLITADAIRQLDDQRTIILCSNYPMILGRTSYYFDSWKYAKYGRINPIHLQGDIPDEPVKLLNKPTNNANKE